MELAIITAKQVVILYCLILAGFAGVKSGVIKPEAKKAFSNLLLYLAVPAMVIHSYISKADRSVLARLPQTFAFSVLAILAGLAITMLCTCRMKGKERPILRFACIFSNAAYMGFPLIEALFGAEGLIYASVYVTVFNILLWTVGFGHDYRNRGAERGRPHSLHKSGADCRGDRTGDLPVPDSCAGGDRTAVRADRKYEYAALHDYYRNDDRRKQSGADALRPAHFICDGNPHAADPCRVLRAVFCMRLFRDGCRRGAAAGSMPERGDHLRLCGAVFV